LFGFFIKEKKGKEKREDVLDPKHLPLSPRTKNPKKKREENHTDLDRLVFFF
jgi:hypothetical protein